MTDVRRIVTYQGNLQYIPITIRDYNTRTPRNLSSVTSITLEWEDELGVEQVAINVLSSFPGADWPNGIVALPLRPGEITDELQTVTASLTVLDGGQTITYGVLTIEVKERPGYPSA